jgi:hypothetical protein
LGPPLRSLPFRDRPFRPLLKSEIHVSTLLTSNGDLIIVYTV